MEHETVKLQSIELRNLKNVGYGYVKFVSKNNAGADMLGIYGQNGSGKTTLVYAIDVLKALLTGKKLKRDCIKYIKSGKKSAGAVFEFLIRDCKDNSYKAVYEFMLEKKETDKDESVMEENNMMTDEEDDRENSAFLTLEKLSMSMMENGKWTKMTPVLYYSADSKEILPKNRYHLLTKGKQEMEDELRVLRLLSAKEGRSFLFSKELKKIINNAAWEEEYKAVFRILNEYAIYSLHIFKSEDVGRISANIALPFPILLKEKDKITLLEGDLNLNGVSHILKRYLDDVKIKMDAISLVLREMIPGLTIYLRELCSSLTKTGEEYVKAQIMANRSGVEIPLYYESDGVKKLVSILYCLILVFNDSSTTLVVDELDSGIFEYLLGEILKVVEESGKGQLIFTSHNLRALEVLNHKNIMFTTTNENNRYIRFKNVKVNNNFRDMYFHDIMLGGQNEYVYEATNSYKIASAFRMAGDEDAE